MASHLVGQVMPCKWRNLRISNSVYKHDASRERDSEWVPSGLLFDFMLKRSPGVATIFSLSLFSPFSMPEIAKHIGAFWFHISTQCLSLFSRHYFERIGSSSLISRVHDGRQIILKFFMIRMLSSQPDEHNDWRYEWNGELLQKLWTSCSIGMRNFTCLDLSDVLRSFEFTSIGTTEETCIHLSPISGH